MRDRLIKLIGKELLDYASWNTEMTLAGSYNMPSVEEVIADKILKDGWFRPPCKVGDTVYLIPLEGSKLCDYFVGVLETECVGYFIGKFGTVKSMLKLQDKGHGNELYSVDFDDVGKIAFFDRKTAETFYFSDCLI